MGCTPTAQRLNSIPSCNVNASTKSTKGTVKKTDQILSPQKLPLCKEKNDQKYKVKRYYSPKYVPIIKVREQGRANGKNRVKDVAMQKQGKKNEYFKQKMQVKNFDIISHLSLNSQYEPEQKFQFLQYEARTPQKISKQIEIELKKSQSRNKKQQRKQTKPNQVSRFHKKSILQCRILEKELRNINIERFERIKIYNMNF